MWNLTASAYFNRRGMTPTTSIVHDTDMKVRIHGVTSQMNRFRYLAVRDHAGRTIAETSRQLELNSAAQVASVTMVNKWRGWRVETLKGIRAMSKYAQQLVSSSCPSIRYSEALDTSKVDWVGGIHHHDTSQILANTIKPRTWCGSIPTSLDPTKQATDWGWYIWVKHAALGTGHKRQLWLWCRTNGRPRH